MGVRALLVMGCVLTTTGCGSDTLTLETDPSTVVADGMSVVELRAQVSFRGGALSDGKRVTFTANAPVLFKTREATVPDAPGLRPEGETAVEARTSGGVARAFLLAPTSEQTITVQASFTTVNQEVLADSVDILATPPPSIAAGSNPGGTLGQEVPHFGIACERVNLGGFVTNRPEIRIGCTIQLEDRTGKAWPHTPVMLFAEAGTLKEIPATKKEPRRFEYVIGPSPTVLPRDVPASDLEEQAKLSDSGPGLIPGAIDQNPRDGLVTLLAVVRGHESFHDSNGNGRYDEGEFFIDEGEPFLDVDDDGVYTAADGPHCCDTNGNGRVDGPNGRWDDDVWIGRMTHVLWTGPVSTGVARSEITPPSPTIAAQGHETFTLQVTDANFNPVAAGDARDAIVMDLTGKPSRRVDFDPPGEPTWPLTDELGLVVEAAFPTFVFGQGASVVKGIRQEGRVWEFTLKDTRTAGSSSLDDCFTWSVVAEVRTTAGPGRDHTRRTAQVSTSGDLAGLQPCTP